MGIFSKKSGSVTHNYIWAPNTMLSEKTNEPNLTEGQTEGRMDGPYFMGPFWPRPGFQKNGVFPKRWFYCRKVIWNSLLEEKKLQCHTYNTIYDIIARNKMISIRNRRHFYQILNCHRIPEISKDFSNSGCYKIISHLENMNPPSFL